MKRQIVQSHAPVVLVGGGACPNDPLRAALSEGGAVVAADGGALRLLDLGVMPDAVFGDMDSLPPAVQARLAPGVLRPIAEQDSTDFDKCLRHIAAPLVLAHGFLGARVDHELAAMTVLARHPDRRCILVGEADVITLCPPRLGLTLPQGARVSLFPLGPVAGRSEGLRWPIDDLAFTPWEVIGTSNEATGPVLLEMDAPLMLLILPLNCLPSLRAGLAAAPETWPARAV